ncbi:ABC-three component system middle component 5 [Maridesulfovibrio salexigens]|uniref:Uncharacterized protein n=1 Tax=Maridesulfovibrio salexigens (strain ATCC 14822 / DSM 2638 / NCIMB 8403 / VKM B-1763) TaxID=526222 RepID=C6BWE7_MARSD|nr:ABC-three component system middle component 5 [Maridesulfovibrio salexigens]ACS78391.1 hypothetical protein Desal_0324 [Maridesulfovibrio salexigens DSM 2638]
MLVYNSAFDIYHCMFRIILLLNACPQNKIEYERARIFDYFFAFPQRAQEIKLQRGCGFTKKTFKLETTHYQEIQDDKQIFFEMSKIFEGAVRCLAAYGEIEPTKLSVGTIVQKNNSLSEKINAHFGEIDPLRQSILELFSGPFYNLELTGANGLKARSGLMEFRYDL